MRVTLPFLALIASVYINTPLARAESCVPFENFGGLANNASDNQSSLQRALGSFGASGGCVSFSPGTYVFNSNVLYNFPNVRQSIKLIGSGQDTTILKFTNTSQSAFAFFFNSGESSLLIRDLTIASAGANSQGSGIWLNQVGNPNLTLTGVQTVIDNVAIRGDDSNASSYWIYGIFNAGVSRLQVRNSTFKGGPSGTGKGVVVGGSGATNDPNVYLTDISTSTFTNLTSGVKLSGILAQAKIHDCTFLNDGNGVEVNGIYNLNRAVNIIDNIFQNTGIYLQNVSQFTIIGNQVSGSLSPSSTGIYAYTSSGGVISGNFISGMSTGVYLNFCTGVNVQSNAYVGNTTNTTVNGGSGNTVGGGSALRE